MFVAITGLPGNGKTLYALQFVKDWAERENRPVFYFGIRGLNLHVTNPDGTPGNTKVSWTLLDSTPEKINGVETQVPNWWLAPARSIVLIDEAQMCGFGVRGRGLVPAWAQKLEVHRHLGIDIVFITQQPSLLDGHDRALVERHFHLVRKWGMERSVVHEFKTGIKDNVNKSRVGSIRHEWKFPKAAFGWYVSAEAHTHKRHVPLRFWLMLAMPLLIGTLIYFAWTKYLDPHRAASVGALGGGAASSVYAGNTNAPGQKLTQREYLSSFVPRVQGLAYTAPVYDDVTKVVVAPYPAACISMGSRCGCFSQQGTRLEVPAALCAQVVAGGFFVAWQKAPAESVVSARQVDKTPAEALNLAPAGFVGSPRMEVSGSASILPASRTEDLPPGRGKALPLPSR